MPPPRDASAEMKQTPAQIAEAMDSFFRQHDAAAVLEDGKVVFDMRAAKYALSTEHGRCTLQLWGEERNLVRRVVRAEARGGALRLATLRMGHKQTKLLELVASRERRTPSTRENARTRYVRLLERLLARAFPEMQAEGFRAAMDLERSFGPAYARGSLVRGQKAWAVIGVNEAETGAVVDGILTLGVLWLHHCREKAGGKRLYQGLIVIVPRGTAAVTLSRLGWMNQEAAQWRLYELDEREEELTAREADEGGNLRTRLVHRPNETGARERFGDAMERVMRLVPAGEEARVEQRLRSSTELGFLLHGLEFARARVTLAPGSFRHVVEVTVGAGENETLLTEESAEGLRGLVADLFARRRVDAADAARDPLYRAAPERWLESVLREDLAPLTRWMGPSAGRRREVDEDSAGNRSDVTEESRVIPRFDPQHVYAQVPAMVGSKDRGMLDLLGVTADGRLAVIELKADEDLHLALQGLDYWVRVRHHHMQHADAVTGLGGFQRHGYFGGVVLSPTEPRLYLVAPALRIHPATEVVLRYVSPRVEWHLLALDERWRSRVRVVWRKQR